jgi:hypothetical protein
VQEDPLLHTDMAIAIARMELMANDMSEIKQSMKELASAVSRLAVIEERQGASGEAIGRAFKEISALGARIGVLEQNQPIQKQSSDLVQAAIKYIMAAVLGAILAGFLRVPPTMPTATPPALTGK